MKKLRLIHIEDNADDSELIIRSLRKNGFAVDAILVESAEALAQALAEHHADIVLSDYAMPQFDGLTALKQVIQFDPDLPFILVSGAVGEEIAVELMKSGAKDYIMKDHLGRLGPAVQRELEDAEVREEKNRVKRQKHDLEVQLFQAQKMEAIGTLAGGIAHDFNNILTGILGYAQLAEAELADLPNTRRKVEQVIMAGNRAKELVQHILTFSRKSEGDKKPQELYGIVQDAIKLLRASTPTTIEFKLELSPDAGKVDCNSSRMHQVVMNLCTNAYHAMAEKGGVLSISLSGVHLDVDAVEGQHNPPGSYVKLSISDTGYGISKGVLAKIFDPYFTTKEQGVGTGLGLSLVLGIVKSHGGYITVDSCVEKGTTFTVYLPSIVEGGFADSPALAVHDSPVGGSERILVVDDEIIIVEFCSEILSSFGYTVTTVGDGRAALELFEQDPNQFDLLITDMTMPKMIGTVLAAKVLAIRPDLPIILCTGHSDQVDQQVAENIGIKVYRTKPVPGLELAQLVRSLLDESYST